MSNGNQQQVRPHNFSIAFEQMCSIVAIGKTSGVTETLEELIVHSMFYLSDDKFTSPLDLVNAIDGLFGINIPVHEVQLVLEKLIKAGNVVTSPQGQYLLPISIIDEIQQKIEHSYSLENSVRDGWRKTIQEEYLIIEFERLWKTLRNYLAKAFQRHGIQAVALLDPSIELAQDYSESLSSLLDLAVQNEFESDLRNIARQAISEFMATTGNYPERASYISQLANGAFTYFSLAINPETSAQFRKNLNHLVLFLDTNFLFGVLKLNTTPQVAVSSELLTAIEKHKLPFELKSHKRTMRELDASIEHHSGILRTRRLSPAICRAALASRFLSGVEIIYYQRYIEDGTDVDSFFQPYRHSDILLQEKNIEIYTPTDERSEERATLISEYSEYLEKRKRDKPYNLIDHDMTLLDVVRQARTDASSTLEAGALLITCDYTLYRFDWENSRNNGVKPCTVLPNIFWQVIRPFVALDGDFDKSFAETFAIPEFRIMGSKASEACSKMLNILASYKDFSEETATRMLSNDILIEKLEASENDVVFQELVEDAIVAENNVLIEEKAMIELQLLSEKQKREKEVQEERLWREKDVNEAKRREAEIISETNAKLAQEQKARSDVEVQLQEAQMAIQKEKDNRKAEDEKFQRERDKSQKISAGLLSIIFVGIFELVANILPISWIITHPHSFLLQLVIDIAIVLFILAIFVSKWRKPLLALEVITLVSGTLLSVYLAK